MTDYQACSINFISCSVGEVEHWRNTILRNLRVPYVLFQSFTCSSGLVTSPSLWLDYMTYNTPGKKDKFWLTVSERFQFRKIRTTPQQEQPLSEVVKAWSGCSCESRETLEIGVGCPHTGQTLPLQRSSGLHT